MIESKQPSREEILTCHSETHVNRIYEASNYVDNGENQAGNSFTFFDDAVDFEVLIPEGKSQSQFEVDCYENRYTTQAILISCGGALEASRAVLNNELDSAFCLTRPPGHHAHCEKIAGFCFLNYATVVAKNMQKEFSLKKVLIFDWDVHFGDGTAQIFEDDPSVLFVSIH
jgi:acetoin utilization deacetylase AcuC-like enzyme